MPKGPAPAWRARKPPFLDSHIAASVAASPANEHGHYGELVYAGCETKERAQEIKRALYRAAQRAKLSVHAEIEKAGNQWSVRFKAIDKSAARKYVIERYGTDRSQWPYNPRKRGT